MSGVRVATLDRLITGERYDPILIVGKVVGLEWATVRALILLRLAYTGCRLQRTSRARG